MAQEQKEYRTVWRFYTIADYDREERWLNDMAAAGWNFVRTNGVRFVFRKGTPGEFRYKIDLAERTADDRVQEEYYNFLTDCGLRIVCDFKEFIYLQKPTAEGPFDAADDTYARLRVLNKAYDCSLRMVCRLLRLFTVLLAGLLLLQGLLPASEFLHGMAFGLSVGAVLMMKLIWLPINTRLRRRVTALIGEIVMNL